MNEARYGISVKECGGWVRVYLEWGEPAGELAPLLSRTLTAWMQLHPEMRVKHIAPISRDGDTAELHAWYDVVPDPSVAAKPDERNSPE